MGGFVLPDRWVVRLGPEDVANAEALRERVRVACLTGPSWTQAPDFPEEVSRCWLEDLQASFRTYCCSGSKKMLSKFVVGWATPTPGYKNVKQGLSTSPSGLIAWKLEPHCMWKTAHMMPSRSTLDKALAFTYQHAPSLS